MSDVTFVRGYGFPRGSSMDYAGYSGHTAAGYGHPGSCGGGCGCAGCGSRPMGRALRGYGARTIPDASLFATIPALDGYNETEGETEVTVGPITMQESEMVLPTYDFNTAKWYDAQGREVDPSTGRPTAAGLGLFALLGLGLVGAALFLK